MTTPRRVECSTPDITVTVPASRGEHLPRAFGRYTLLYHLARGGMGEVYLAVVGDLRGFERVCVVKTVRAEYAAQRSFVDRFLDEGQLLTRLSHGHIAQVLDVGQHEDSYFVALEYVEGKDLSKVLERLVDRQRPMPVAVALHITLAVLDALAYAHRRTDRDGKELGLIHRDVSPQNVLVSYDGDVKLIDFGNARTEVRRHSTAAGLIYGKPGYIAPEQARGEKPDRRSDLYALGVTLWEALSGQRLMDQDLDVFLPRLRQGKIKPAALSGLRSDVPPELDRIVARAVAADRQARYPDAASFRTELAALLARIAPTTGPATAAELMRELWDSEILVERRLIAQLLERAPAATTSPILAPAASQEQPSARYRILRKLGEGAMGEVFAAEHIDLEKIVALKILHRDFSQNQAFVERFRREARAVAKIGHPNIVQVTDFGETADGRVFFAMEKLEGESLESRLQRVGALPEDEALRIAETICVALVATHGEGIIHRDLKPDNVFLCSDGLIKLLDFGIAKTMGLDDAEKLTRAGEIFGTPEYMAPEQAANRGVDQRTDLYAVGAILYEMVTGTLPFRAESAVEILHAQINEPPEPPSRRAPERRIRPATEKVILTALAKRAEQRFPSAEAMAAEVHAASTSRARSNRGPLVWGAVLATLAVLSGAAFLSQREHAPSTASPRPSPRVQAPAPSDRPGGVPSPAPSALASDRPVPGPPSAVRAAPSRPPTTGASPAPTSREEAPKPGSRAQRDRITEMLLGARRLREQGDRRGAVREAEQILRQPGGGRLDVRLFYIEALAGSGHHTDAANQLRILAQRHPENTRVQDLMNQLGVSP